MNEKSVGKMFMNEHGEVFQCVSYCENPTITFRRLGTEEQVGGAVGSLNVRSMVQLHGDEDTLVRQMIKQFGESSMRNGKFAREE
jgi:hypothetical protein